MPSDVAPKMWQMNYVVCLYGWTLSLKSGMSGGDEISHAMICGHEASGEKPCWMASSTNWRSSAGAAAVRVFLAPAARIAIGRSTGAPPKPVPLVAPDDAFDDRLLELPAGVFPLYAMSVGVPDGPPTRKIFGLSCGAASATP